MRKNVILKADAIVMPPFLTSMPRGAPTRVNNIHATASVNFLWISTRYLLLFFS